MNDKIRQAYQTLKDSGLSIAEIEDAVASEDIQPHTARWKGDKGYMVDDDRFFERVTVIDRVAHRRHPNGGGLVAETATVAPTAFVGVDAQVYGDAQVCDDALV